MRSRLRPLSCTLVLLGTAALAQPAAAGPDRADGTIDLHRRAHRSRAVHRMRGLPAERNLAFTDGLRRALPRERRLSFADGDAAAWPEDRTLSYSDGDLARLRPRLSGLSYSDPPLQQFDPEYYDETVESSATGPANAIDTPYLPQNIRRGAPPASPGAPAPSAPRAAPPKLVVVSADRDERVARPMHTLEMDPWMLLEEGHATSATKRFAARTQISPERPLAWIGLSLATADRGRTLDAARLLRRAVTIDAHALDAVPVNPLLHARIAVLLAEAEAMAVLAADTEDRANAGFLVATLLYLHDDATRAGAIVAASVAEGDRSPSTLALRDHVAAAASRAPTPDRAPETSVPGRLATR